MIKILVGEDDHSLQELYSTFLPMFGYDAVVVSSGPEVIEKLPIVNPDVIILDVMLNGSDGREVCKKIKSIDSNKKVILISAHPKLINTYKDFGADAAIEKPFNLKDILTKIDLLASNSL